MSVGNSLYGLIYHVDNHFCALFNAERAAEKADIIAKAIEGPVTSMISGSAIQFHPDCVVILDEEAAAKLEGKEDYAFAVKNSPKYKDFL